MPDQIAEPPPQTSISAAFDRATQSQLPSAEPEPPKPAAPVEPTPVAPAAAPEPPPPSVSPPDTLLPSEQLPPPSALPKVADLMPEDPEKAGIKTEKGKADYRKWREHQLKLEKTLEERSKAPQPTADADILAQNEFLKNKLAELSGVVERVDLLQHPAFQQQFLRPRQEAFDSAAALLKDFEIDPNVLDKALSLTGKARIEALDELTGEIESPSARIDLMNQIDRIKQLDHAKAAAMADVKGNALRMEQEERAGRHRRAMEQEKELVQEVDMAVETLKQNGFGMFLTEIPGNEEHNTKVRQRIADAKGVFTLTTSRQQLASVAQMGRLAPDILAWALSERTKRLASDARTVSAEKEIAELKGARPGLESERTSYSGEEVRDGISGAFARVAKSSGVFTPT